MQKQRLVYFTIFILNKHIIIGLTTYLFQRIIVFHYLFNEFIWFENYIQYHNLLKKYYCKVVIIIHEQKWKANIIFYSYI